MVAPSLIYGGLVLALVAAALAVLLARHSWDLRSDLAPAGRPDVWSPWCASEGGSAGERTPRFTLAELLELRPWIRAWVLRGRVPERDAEDVVQNVIKGAWESRLTWTPESSKLSTWGTCSAAPVVARVGPPRYARMREDSKRIGEAA